MRQIIIALVGLLSLPLGARADNRTMQVVAESVDIAAEPVSVWNIVKPFDGIHVWHPGIPSSPLVQGKDGQPGAVRAITVKNGPTFHEELLGINDAEMAFTYRIVESPLPLEHYRSTMTVRPNASGGSVVVWIGNFVRKNPVANPPEAESDADAVKLISGVYAGGLQNLKAMLEHK